MARYWRWALLFIALLAFFLRAYFAFSAVVDHPIRGDAIQYVTAAWNMVHRHAFSITPPDNPAVVGDSYRDPGYPCFLAGWLLLFGHVGEKWYSAILAAQALLGAVTIPLLLSALRHHLPERWLLGGGLFMAVWPHSVTVCSYLLSETLFAFLCSLSLFLLSFTLNRKGYLWPILCGLGFGTAALTNAMLIPFALLLAAGLYGLRYLDRKSALALAAAGLLLPATWQVRNMQLPASNETSGGRALINFVQGSWPEYHSSWRAYVGGNQLAKRMQEQILEEANLLREQPASGAKAILTRFQQAPAHYFFWYLSKPMQLWGWDIQIGQGDIYIYPTLHSPFSYNLFLRAVAALCHAANPLLMLFAAWGCLTSLLRKTSTGGMAAALALMALYSTLIYSVLQAEPRYAIPFRGVEIALATIAMWQICAWVKRHRRPVA